MALTFKHLSKNQDRILRLLALGKTNREIAEEIGVTEVSIKSQISTIFDRCGLTSRQQVRSYLASMDRAKK